MTNHTEALVEVEESHKGRYQQAMKFGPHVLIADEPASVGGNDAGPGPYEYLLMGLGACTSMTIRMYAERKQIPLENVQVRLNHSRIHAEDCSDCDTRMGMVDEITRYITLTGDLVQEDRQRLLEIADRCPVHRTLTSEIKIRTTLLPG